MEVAVKAILIISLLSTENFAHNTEISIEDAVKRNLVSANFTSLSGHEGNCIEAQLINKQNNEISLFFEPGRIINSAENNLQDIILTKKMSIKINGYQKKIVPLYGFCCQLSNSSPLFKSNYLLGKMADSGLVKLANFLNQNNFDLTTQQKAVWCLSDNNSLESVPQTFDSSSNALIGLCAKLKNTAVPNNFFTYLNLPNIMFSNIKYFYKTKVEYQKKSNTKLMIAVFDTLGNAIKVIADNNYSTTNNNTYKLCFSVYNWKKGKYYLRILEGNKKEFESSFEI